MNKQIYMFYYMDRCQINIDILAPSFLDAVKQVRTANPGKNPQYLGCHSVNPEISEESRCYLNPRD